MTTDSGPHRTTSVSRHVDASPARVFGVLADAWMIPVWLVGAGHIRDVDGSWPAQGARLHHRIGPWPLSVDDSTQVVEVDEPSKLVLRARMWPVGEAHVELHMEPEGDGTLVTMVEGAARGPALWLDNGVQRWVLRKRNEESLARLATVAEKRPQETPLRAQRPSSG
jgi:uncharacterized protein YndB with AHSA1/START domain